MEVCAMGSQERHLQERVVDETAYIETTPVHIRRYTCTHRHIQHRHTLTHMPSPHNTIQQPIPPPTHTLNTVQMNIHIYIFVAL